MVTEDLLSFNILDSTKQYLGIIEDDSFDSELKVYINMSIDILKQHCDVGDDINEMTFTPRKDKQYMVGLVLSYIFIRTKILFDPPAMSYNVTILKEQSEELLWRIKTEYNVESVNNESK